MVQSGYSKHSITPEPTGPAWGFNYDVLFKSFNLPDLSADDATNVYEFFSGGDDSGFSTRANVPIVTPDSNATSAFGTHDSENIEVGHVDGNYAQANPNTRVGHEAPADPINIESSSSGTQDMGELSTNLDSEIQEPDIPETRVHKNHPIDNIIGEPLAGVQTRHKTIPENTKSKNVKEALANNCWIEAMQDELSQFQKLHVWDFVDQPRGVQPIGTIWVFKCKTDDRHVVVKNKIDSTLFTRKVGGDILLVQVYVDDIIFGSTNEELCREFEQDILKKYKMNDSSTCGTPIPVNHGLHPDKDGKNVDCKLYHGMIGSIMYLTASRPDIMFVICLCSRFQLQPKESDMIAVKRIFRYLKGKLRLGLWYSKQQSFDFKVYTDSDYGGCNLDRKSTSGGCQFLGDRLVSWQCKKQSTVSVSTCETEYIAAASGCSQILWIQQQLRDYVLNFTGTPLFIDNNATMSITNNPVKHSKTKYIEFAIISSVIMLKSILLNL
ncbi:hypothetical protein L1987_63835 [Smallanthus sonchifolius]|uniref:Uncharacterized protein n=1 Tax=Smallanthus sonchifolius TaxID=185202 RepID=A0ACB9CEE5_9ASTR|nr:hypothetical protein L1987_63835 [Smallanthus sonchifolius]